MKLVEQVKTTMKFARVSLIWGLVGGLLLLVVTLSTGCIKTTGASVQTSTKILFASTCSGNYEIYTMSPDGSEVVQITADGTDNREPDWAPNGSQIAFKSTRNEEGTNPEGDFEIFIMQADGSNVRQLTHDSRDDRHPVFSAGGKTVYYVSMTAEGHFQLYSVGVKGGAAKQLTEMVGGVKMPAVSSDGRWLLFQTDGGSETNDTQEIYKMRPDGRELTRLTNNTAHDKVPHFSPDGNYITFQSKRDGDYEVYRMKADGSEQTRLTRVEGKDKRTGWSPDGKRISFQSTRTGHWEIYTMNPDGSDQRQLTSGGCDSHMPKWSGYLTKK